MSVFGCSGIGGNIVLNWETVILMGKNCICKSSQIRITKVLGWKIIPADYWTFKITIRTETPEKNI